MGQPGRGDDNVAELEQRFNRMLFEYTLRVMRIRGLIDGLDDTQDLDNAQSLDDTQGTDGTQRFVDFLARVHGIEQQFNLVQGEYELRISRMQVEIDQCKSQSQTSGISRYSSNTFGGSSSAPRY
jgi:hypothetical protein